ncbi:DUF4139 domain-containing protein [Sphingomicrobium flavum]|uniref:DUF4139 domain-containing protein n=1 Tax=Sphingomicrobium flavum TaxID=1229164 RepID=UPI0021ADD32A|nr:DUF4139 domain-containing protein [Sphingomicrobium flavum]
MRLPALLLAATALIASPAVAQSDDETAQGDVSLTIYNGNVALVQDVRQMSFPAGRSRQEFPDVSAQIRAETVSFNAPGTAIIEQNFDYDLLTPRKMMEKAVGQDITIIRINPATGAETRERAHVLSANQGVVLRIGNRIEVLRDDNLPTRVIFDRVPSNLRARPTLSVTVDSNRSGLRPTSISYLTPGLSWSADYVALFDEAKGSIDVQGWITLANNTGTTFHNADVLMVAGDMNTNMPGRRGIPPPPPPRPNAGRPGTEAGTRDRLGDFYLYPLDKRTTVANAQTKQVSFLDTQGARAEKRYEFVVPWRMSMDTPQNAFSVIKFDNSSSGGLGDQLPAGTVRVYLRDAAGQPQFIGESRIDHTPMGSELALRTGQAFDIMVDADVISRDVISSDEWESYRRYRIHQDGVAREVRVDRNLRYYRTTMRYTLTNAKPTPVTVDLLQAGLDSGWRDVRIVEETLPGRQINVDQRLYEVPVPAEGETVLTVTYATPY